MIILGIDPGYERCGFAVLEVVKGNQSLKTYGIIKTSAQQEFAERQTEIGDDIQALLDKYKPDICSVENLFFVQNVTTGLRVAQVRGIVTYLAKKSGCEILEPNPTEIKKCFCGDGKADKKAMQFMAQKIFSLQQKPAIDDAADAIGAAFFAAQNLDFLQKSGIINR